MLKSKLKISLLKIKYYIIFIIILLYLYIYIYNIQQNNKSLKICICTIGKKENLYIKEFIEHYKRYAVDIIYLYDNNDINGEKFENVILNYIKNGFVKIINYRGIKVPQLEAYNDCYKKNNMLYKWLIFYDIDEFIFLKKHKNIKSFLNSRKFNKCQKIELNWYIHTDNNKLYYENKSLSLRFPEKIKYSNDLKFKNYTFVKSIVKGDIRNLRIINIHHISNKLHGCNGFVNSIKYNGKVNDFRYNYIDHYLFKSTYEFITKINKGDAAHVINNKFRKIKAYFMFNKITEEKINYIEKMTNINLSLYKKSIKSQN